MGDETQLSAPAVMADIFERFEGMGYFDELTLASRLVEAIENMVIPTGAESKSANAEIWAFRFYPTDDGKPSCWNTYFGPCATHGAILIPDIASVDVETVKYWTSRATQVRHPIMRARYADLVWDLSKRAGAPKASIEAARIAVDGYVACATLADEEYSERALNRLQRGLHIALGIRDQVRAIQARNAIFELLGRINEAWGWCEAYRIFEEETKFDRVKPTEEQMKAVIEGLEADVTLISVNEAGVSPTEAFFVADKLATYYRSLDRQVDLNRVVLAAGHAVERKAERTVRSTLCFYFLTEVCQFYRSHGFIADADRIQFVAREKGEQAESEMHEVTLKFEVPMDETKARNEVLTEGGLDEALNRIVEFFLPNIERIRADLGKVSLSSLASGFAIGEGHVTGKLGPVADEPEGALHAAIDKFIVFSMFDLQMALDHAWKRYSVTPDHVVDFLCKSPVFLPKFRSIIQLGIEAYFANDHPKAIHLLVPQIENSLRATLPLLGVVPDKARRGDTSVLLEKSLNDILEHEDKVKDFFGQFSSGAHLYLLSFLAESRGRNLRNRMFHGLMCLEEFNRNVSDRVLHILLMLGQIETAPIVGAASDPAPESDRNI